MEKKFFDWTESDRENCGYTAQWSIETGSVLWAHGAVSRQEMAAKGKPMDEFLTKVN